MAVESPKTIDFNYIKSGDFREVSCDGVVGGPTPQGKVWLAFFTERFPLPRIVRHALQETSVEGQLQLDASIPPEQLDGRSGVIRNVEFGVYLTREIAIELRNWLDKQIIDSEPKK